MTRVILFSPRSSVLSLLRLAISLGISSRKLLLRARSWSMGQPVKRPRGRMVILLWSRDRELSEVGYLDDVIVSRA